MNKLHAIWMLCASFVLPSVLLATPTIPSFTINGNGDAVSSTNRNIEAVAIVNPSKVTGAGSVISKVEFFVDGVLKSTVIAPTSVVLNPGPPAAPKTYTFKYKASVAAGSHTFKAIAYENSIPVTSTTTSVLTVDVVDAAPEITEIVCSPNAISYVANPTVAISAAAKVKDDVKVTKVEFYWVPNGTGVEPGTLKNTVLVNAAAGTATYLYTGINVSGELRILAYDELGNQPTESRKLVNVVPNAAPNCGPELSFTDPLTFVTSTFTSPVIKSGATVVAGPLFNPGTVTIQIAAQDETGTVTKMELFNNNILFATSTTPTAINSNFSKPPYYMFTFTFPALAAGTYKFSWKATDSYGAFCVSDVANPTVLTVAKCEDANEPANNLKTGATTLTIPSVKYAKIASTTDVDWYKITSTGFTNITLSGTNATGDIADLPADFDMALYTSSGKSSTTPIAVSQNDGTTPEGLDLSLFPAGTYLLKVYGYGDAAAVPAIPNAFSTTACYRLQVSDGGARARTLGKSTKKPILAEVAAVTMLLMPNPASNQVTLLTGVENAGEYQLAITDFLGRELKRQTLNLNEGENTTSIDISAMGKGMYMVRLWNDKQQMVQKLSVEK